MKLIDYHNRWSEQGQLNNCGLCNALQRIDNTLYRQFVELFYPEEEEMLQIKKERLSEIFWASGLSETDKDRAYGYTELRQNIVLLLCAINGEL